MASISERENREIVAADASGNTPVVFIHDAWVSASHHHSTAADVEDHAGDPACLI